MRMPQGLEGKKMMGIARMIEVSIYQFMCPYSSFAMLL